MSDWRETTLGEFIALQRGHDLTETQRRSGTIPVIGSAGENGSHDTARAKGPGVVIGRSGASFGQVHFCSVDFWPHNTTLYVTDFRGNCPLFVYYLLKTIDFDRYNSGSAQASLNRNFIYPMPIRVPQLGDQEAIASILGALDDKIELNRRMNATLEAMARALFQSWFVDFDPVRAKLDGHTPAVESAPSLEFPDSFENTCLGLVPRGWSVDSIGNVVDCVGGGTPSTVEPKYWDKGHHCWTTPKDFSTLQAPFLTETDRKVTDLGLTKISSGLLPAGTVLMSSRAPVGYLAIAAMPVAINQGFVAIRPNERLSSVYLLNWCKENMHEIKRRATGTTFEEISKANFRPIDMILPPQKLVDFFTEAMSPSYRRILSNVTESRTLAQLRDTMLPKLLSGELSVKNLESKVAAVL